jgi:AraC-like DNA-binding protein
MSHWMHPTDEKLYPPHRIAALVELLRADGVSVHDALQGTGLDMAALCDAACRTSLAQYRQVCHRAVTSSTSPSLPFRAGETLHLSDHGMYGLLLLSCDSVRDHFMLAQKYQLLAAPALAFECHEGEGETVHLRLARPERTLPRNLERFLVEQQFMAHLVHLGDTLGTPGLPVHACFAYPAPAHRALYDEYFRCPCSFDCDRSELQFSHGILSRRPLLASTVAAATVRSVCDGLLDEFESALGFAGKVYRALHEQHDPGAGMKAVAAALQMTDRTLRRRLVDEGTSFSAIVHRVRYGVAARHLRHTDASIEQVAAIAGFSDPANFRRAFLRWTRMTPAQFRRQHTA